MIPRGELAGLLHERLKNIMPQNEIDQLVGEIAGLEGGWEEMDIPHGDMGYSVSSACSEICWLASEIDRGSAIRLYRKKKS